VVEEEVVTLLHLLHLTRWLQRISSVPSASFEKEKKKRKKKARSNSSGGGGEAGGFRLPLLLSPSPLTLRHAVDSHRSGP